MKPDKKQFMDKQILYSVMVNSDKEFTYGLDEELIEYIMLYQDSKNCIKINKYIGLGVSALSLLDNNNFEFNENLQKEIDILRMYLMRCVDNDGFCNNNIFLAYIKETLHKFIPSPKIYTSLPYSDKQLDNNIVSEDNNSKLNAMLFNMNHIELKRDYVCDGIIDLIICSLFEIFSKNAYIRKCDNCGRYFVTTINKESIKFCNYISPENSRLTCRKLMNQTNYVNKRKTDILTNKYTALFNKYKNRYERAQDKKNVTNIDEEIVKKHKTKLENLKNKYRDIRDSIKKGKITKEEGVKILENFDKED